MFEVIKEYLMTYGWAILIVIAVVAALWGMGVFDPSAINAGSDFCKANGWGDYQSTGYDGQCQKIVDGVLVTRDVVWVDWANQCAWKEAGE